MSTSRGSVSAGDSRDWDVVRRVYLPRERDCGVRALALDISATISLYDTGKRRGLNIAWVALQWDRAIVRQLDIAPAS